MTKGKAHIDVGEAHHELCKVDPERAVVDPRSLKSAAIRREGMVAALGRVLRVALAVAACAVWAHWLGVGGRGAAAATEYAIAIKQLRPCVGLV